MDNSNGSQSLEKVLKDYTPNEKRCILKAFDKLKKMIATEESYGTRFENIYNNDSIKYDVYKGDFYAFKSKGCDNTQIRILYRFIRYDDLNYDIQMHKVYIKRRNTKEYLNVFTDYVENYVGGIL